MKQARSIIILTIVAILSLSLTSIVTAQSGTSGSQPGPPTPTPTPFITNNNGNIVSQQNNQILVDGPIYGSALTSWGVYGKDGKITGEIRGFLMDTANGSIPYFVVLGDDFLAFHTVLVPWDAFHIIQSPASVGFIGNLNINPHFNGNFNANGSGSAAAGHNFDPARDLAIQLDITESQYQNAPGFDINQFTHPENLSSGWDAGLANYWNGILPNANIPTTHVTSGLILIQSGVFNRINLPVVNQGGKLVGSMTHVLINGMGDIHYGLVSPVNLNLNLGNMYLAVSFQALNWIAAQQHFVLTFPQTVLADAPVFDPANLPDFANPAWDQPWNNYWAPYETQGSIPATGSSTNVGRQLVMGHTIYYGANNNRVLGVVQDVITGNNHQIQYLVVYDVVHDEFHPIPWNMFQYNNQSGRLVYEGNFTRFIHSPGFNNLSDINTNQPGWNNKVNTYWGNQQ